MLNLNSENNIILGTSCPSDIDDSVVLLAQQLSKIHGKVKVASESGGVHLYIASPICLDLYGESELLPSKMHLAVNADKYLGRPPYDKPHDFAALCMKTGESYKISDLLSFKSLQQRGFRPFAGGVSIMEKKTYTDDEGKPLPPGETTPILELDDNHPARVYIKSRDFSAESLAKQFDLQFCTAARDDVFFRKLGYGFTTSPQNRIIFNIRVDGEVRGWQSRIMEIQAPGSDGELYKFFYHTTQSHWYPVFKKVGEEWERLPGSDKWDPAKYVLGYGTRRNLWLMGYDATKDHEWIGITEGPLDAARLGPPFCAAMGKSLSEMQANLCRNRTKIVLAIQNDTASDQFRVSAMGRFRNLGIPVIVIKPPDGYDDYGDMSQAQADEFIGKVKKEYSL